MTEERWMPLTKAAEMMEVSQAKLSWMVKHRRIKSKRDPKDERKRLVDVKELERIFYPQE
jgi:hypothetical protein